MMMHCALDWDKFTFFAVEAPTVKTQLRRKLLSPEASILLSTTGILPESIPKCVLHCAASYRPDPKNLNF